MAQKILRNQLITSRIQELEQELSITKYNKRTQHHIGLLKAKISLLNEKHRKATSSKSIGFSIKKSGDASVVIIGFPSVGKSTLLNALTNAKSKTASYAFTTLDCIPGIMEYNQSKIQVIDLPGILQGASSGIGRGKDVLSVAQNADLIIILVDVNNSSHLPVIMKELHNANIRLNAKKPDVKFLKKDRGGIEIGTMVKLTKIDFKTIKDVLKEYGIHNASLTIREDIDIDHLIDIIEGNKKYMPCIIVLNKIDTISTDEIKKIKDETNSNIEISAENNLNIHPLKELIFRKLDFIRIYCKETNKKADMDKPLILKAGATLKDFCNKLHKDFLTKFRYARINGKSVKFANMIIRNTSHQLKDGDIVQVYLK